MLISPSKTLDLDSAPLTKTFTTPSFLDESKKLIGRMKKYSKPEICKLMNVSEKLAELNYKRYRSWKIPFSLENSKQAVFAFKGDVYTGLNVDTFNAQELKYCQKHLRILSGLYGLLRPLDLIQAYRLEMGTKFDAKTKDTLYNFWDLQITDAVNDALKQQGDDFLINLASNEYYKVIKPNAIQGEIITPNFKEFRNGEYKMIGLFAKQARGMMSHYIIKNLVTSLDELKKFNLGNYKFNTSLSEGLNLIFTRKQP